MYMYSYIGHDEWDNLKIIGPLTVDEFRNHFTNRLKFAVNCVMINDPQIVLYAEYNPRANGRFSNL